ncbi:hypothetical protein [Palleronia caenipelagi]|uniref:Sulfotransferase domain-containing protein n=1 Tax=Palleronia caenipelagi TaxID=2489174 RepID=A0A547PQ36_9RHOB|nr:hypothetical protein [Palleronia caenipelagi]TRD16261.1 hypothetical protein FEV53_14520 [Palleronia caenipelagi]
MARVFLNQLRNQTLDGPTPGRIMRFFGVRRSGNHAVIDWIMSNLPDTNHIHFNTVGIGGRLNAAKAITVNGQELRQIAMSPTDMERFEEDKKRADVVTIFYEDQPLRQVLKFAERITPDYDPYRPVYTDIIIRRSFLNWIASVYQHPKKFGLGEHHSVGTYATIFRSIEAWKHLLLAESGDIGMFKGAVVLSYDEWLQSSDYRSKFLSTLHIEPRNLELPDRMSHYGGGSSFESDDRKNRSDITSLLKRINVVSEMPGFLRMLDLVLSDPEVEELLAKREPDQLAKAKKLQSKWRSHLADGEQAA